MQKLNLLVCMLLFTGVTACKIKWLAPEPESKWHAVTDGKLTLGAVASKTERGLNAYRLLICKKIAAHNEEHFNDSNFCRPALIGRKDEEVVLLVNERRRNLLYKYSGYVVGGAAALLAAFGIRQGIKWTKMRGNYIDEASESAETVVAKIKIQDDITGNIISNEQLVESAQKKIAAKTATISAAEEQAAKLSQEIAQLQKQLEVGLVNADAKEIDVVISRLKHLNPELGDELHMLVYGSNARLNPELLEALSKQTEKIDTIFAKELQALKTNPQVILGNDGVLFYREAYDNIFVKQHQQVMDGLAKNAEVLIQEKPANFKSVLTNAVGSRREGALLLDAALELRLLEQYHKTLKVIDSSDSNAIAQQTKKVRNYIASHNNPDLPIDTELASRLGIDSNADFSTKFRQIEEKYQALTEDDYFAILKPDASMSDYHKHLDAVALENLYLRGKDNFKRLRNNQEYLKLYDKANTDVYRNELKRLDNDIAKARERLLTLEASRVETVAYTPKVEQFWQRLLSLEGLENILRKSHVTRLHEEVGVLKLQMEKRSITLGKQQELLNNLQGKYAHLNKELLAGEKILAGHQQNLVRAQASVKNLERQLNSAKEEKFHEIKKVYGEMHRKRRSLGEDILFSMVGTLTMTAVSEILFLEASLWGRAEKAVGKEYWQQIFIPEGGFAKPMPVNDLPAIVQKIADVFNRKVNPQAFYW